MNSPRREWKREVLDRLEAANIAYRIIPLCDTPRNRLLCLISFTSGDDREQAFAIASSTAPDIEATRSDQREGFFGIYIKRV